MSEFDSKPYYRLPTLSNIASSLLKCLNISLYSVDEAFNVISDDMGYTTDINLAKIINDRASKIEKLCTHNGAGKYWGYFDCTNLKELNIDDLLNLNGRMIPILTSSSIFTFVDKDIKILVLFEEETEFTKFTLRYS